MAKKILIIRFSSMGDIVLTFQVVDAIKAKYPDAEICFLTKSAFADLVKLNKNISTVIVLPQNAKFKELKNLAHKVNKLNFDFIIDLHSNIRTLALKTILKFLGVESKISSISKPRSKEILLFLLKKLYLKMFSPISRLEIYYKPCNELLGESYKSFRANTSKILFSNSEFKFDNYSIVVPGGAWDEKSWGFEKYSEFVSKLIKNQNVVLLGGNKDVVCDKIEKKLESNKVINLKGKTNYNDIFNLVRNSNFVLGNDTGVLHIAEYLDKKCFVIMGPTDEKLGFLPNNRNTKIIGSSLWCRPCSKNGKSCFRLFNKRKCFKILTVNEVFNATL